MNGEGMSQSPDRDAAPIPPGIEAALAELLRLRGSGERQVRSPEELERFAGRLSRVTVMLLGFFLDMERGMEEFRRAYGIPASEPGPKAQDAGDLARRLLGDGGEETLARLEASIQELKVHHAGLLEGYQEAAHEGAKNLLDMLDPDRIRREFAGTRIAVGPFKLSSRLRPVMIQVVWEEFLRRFAQLRALAPADFERFHREGFRRGYRNFRDARTGRRRGEEDSRSE